MSALGIKYMDYYVPEEKLAISDLIDQIEEKDIPDIFSSKIEYHDFARTILDIESVRIEHSKSKFETLEELLIRMFGNEEIRPDAIDLIILIEERPNGVDKNLAQAIQQRFDIKNAFILNMSGNHCANFEVVLNLLTRTKNPDVKHVLIINSTLIDRSRDRIIGTYGILGDAAGVMLLSCDNTKLNILHSCVDHSSQMHMISGENDNNLVHTKHILKCIKETLKKSNCVLQDIQKLIIQNANPLLYTHVLANAGLDTDKIFSDNFGRYGHLDCLDFLVNLSDVCESDKLQKGNLVLSIGMGWAGSYVAILFSLN